MTVKLDTGRIEACEVDVLTKAVNAN